MQVEVVHTLEGLKVCLALRDEVFVTEQGVPPELEHDEYDVLDGAVVHLLLRDELGRPLATARLKPLGPDTAQVQRVAVRRADRGKGHGRAVMDAVEHLAKERGYKRLVLDAQMTALPFYQTLGYIQTSDPFMEAGIQHVAMEKILYTDEPVHES
ncbi:MAG: GNAT family N-acetyltransferase [Alicyclobacillus sp.]|nr:GNAT family N-acetyltransferase [Alicyclobacillus sp.]